MSGGAEVDAAKAAQIARAHAIQVSGNLAIFTFKLDKVEPNTAQDVWKVHCEYVARALDKEPTRYLIRVNTATGHVIDITQES